MLALSLPTLAFAGYDLARRSFLAAYLSFDLGLPIGTVGWLVLLAGLVTIPAELIAGACCDHGSERVGPRVTWMVVGTLLLAIGGAALLCLDRTTGLPRVALALIALVIGWAICNVTHGAWALEATSDGAVRTRVFGLRSLAGLLGGISFSLIGALHHGHLSPFVAILLVASVGAPLVHAGLVVLLPDRVPPAVAWRSAAIWAPVRLLFASRGNRRLAALFALNGAHTAITGTAYLYLVGAALALPAWGATGVLVQSACAAIGIAAMIAYGAGVPPLRTLRAICWINLLLAVAVIVLPSGRPAALMLWSALFGLVSAIDFMALRVLLGERLDLATRADDANAHAAVHYAGFHLPFNLCGALATGMLFAGYRMLGFDPAAAHGAEQAYVAAQLMPACGAWLVMAVALRLVRQYRHERAAPPAAQPAATGLKSIVAEQV